MSSNIEKTCVLVVSGTSSGVGKTTVATGLMAAFAKRGYIVQPYKCGPDFLDGMHHEAAIRAGERDKREMNINGYNRDENGMKGQVQENKSCDDNMIGRATSSSRRRCVNLDGWMMGSTKDVINTFQRHAKGADVCIIEGAMGLHDSRDGVSDDGSAAQVAKALGAPVLLVIDGSMMARSVAAMALGYTLYDPEMRLGAVITNKVGGKVHIQWIAEALQLEGEKGRLKDVGTNQPVYFAGALPNDTSASIPERHLGLTIPLEAANDEKSIHMMLDRYTRLAALIEDNIDLDIILKLGQSCLLSALPLLPPPQCKLPTPKCRIGIADDEAFCFYYVDNLLQLKNSGAELVPFSPLKSKHLPPALDGLYIGGGYPELHAKALEKNVTLRNDVKSFCNSGGVVLAECGGKMYLSETLFTSKDNPSTQMCGVLPGIHIRMTPHMKMYYAEIEFTSKNPLFQSEAGGSCRGQKFHFSEVMNDPVTNALIDDQSTATKLCNSPILVTPQLPGATHESAGFTIHNTFASYFHLYFASYIPSSGAQKNSLADEFVESAITHSPYRKTYAVSFVSAATEIIFALNLQSKLAGVTSLCDFPPQARCAPRQIICHSPIDAASMTSEEVTEAMNKLLLKKQNASGPPGHWLIDRKTLAKIQPSVVFVQNTCDVCDPSSDDVLHALLTCSLDHSNAVHVAPTTLEGLFESILNVASALDARESGYDLVTKLRERLDRVEKELAKAEGSRLRVLSLEGLAPLCVGGNWLPDLKYAAGCEDALGDIGGCSSRILSWEEILTSDPDVILISPCSASPPRTLNELHLLASASEFWKLRCVQIGEVYVIDHGLFARPGPRLVEGVELLATVLRGISAPSSESAEAWKDNVFKYQCQSNDNDSASHCTTELSARFTPFFSGGKLQRQRSQASNNKVSRESISEEAQDDSEIFNSRGLRQCKVTRCTIAGFQTPPSRSAHCLVPVKRNGNKTSLLLFGGEDSDGKRLGDTWELHPPTNGWSAATSEANEFDLSIPLLGNTSTWEHLLCGKVADENVPTLRSNHAIAVCGDYIIVFGGWGVDNVTPLSNCELLHLESLCWTHCSTRGSVEPRPRGNPSLVYCNRGHHVILFGGWNGEHALNDVWCLNMKQWRWTERTKCDERDIWPSARTDHTAVLWEKNSTTDCMLVFGGNVEGKGPCSELWALDYAVQRGPNRQNSDTESGYQWYQLQVGSPSPPARTSHTASIVGHGDSFKMVIVGGTDSSRGVGGGSMLCDAWVFSYKERSLPFWIKLDWSGSGLERCRHAMSVVDSDIILWGGYNGKETVNENASVWQGEVLNNDNDRSEQATSDEAEAYKDQQSYLNERWEAEIPVRLEDLPQETLAKAKRSKLPGATYKALHRHAVANNRDTYIDPASGYSVFSQVYLKRKPCCGNACRHCPYGHINVPGKSNCTNLEESADLEW